MHRAPQGKTTSNDATEPPDRLSPDMASFRLLVLGFVRDYIGRLGESPSYGEIAARLNSNRSRVRRAVKSLAADELLLRSPGARGLALPSLRDAAIRQLRDLGFTVDVDFSSIRPPGGPVTNPPLLPPAELTYPKQTKHGDGDGGSGAAGNRTGGA